MSTLCLYSGGINELKCMANFIFRPAPVAIISSSINESAIIFLTVSSIIGLKDANADAADAIVAAVLSEGPDGNAPSGGGGGGGGGGFAAVGGAGGFTGVIAGVIAGVAKLEGGID